MSTIDKTNVIQILYEVGFKFTQTSIIYLYLEQTPDYLLSFFELQGCGREIGYMIWEYIVYQSRENEKDKMEEVTERENTISSEIVGNQISKGHVILLYPNHPCRILERAPFSYGGKHGPAKIKFTGREIFTGKIYRKKECLSTDKLVKIELLQKESEVLHINDDGRVYLLSPDLLPDSLALDSKDINNIQTFSFSRSDIEMEWNKLMNSTEMEMEMWITIISTMGRKMIKKVSNVRKR